MRLPILSLLIALLTVCGAPAGTLEHVGDWYVSGFYEEPVIVGNTAYVANVYGVAALDVSTPSSINPVSYYPGMGYSYGLDAVGAVVYLANWQDDLWVVDFADPFNPDPLQGVSLNGEAWDVDILDTLVAIACGAEGVYLLDVSDPANPEILSNFGIGGFAVDVLLEGDWVFIAAWDSGAYCYNIADPTTPLQVGSYPTSPGIVRGLDYWGGYLYLAEVNYGLEVLYVDAMGAMQLVGSAPSAFEFFNLEVNESGNRLYICAGLDGLKVYDLPSPVQPTPLYSVPTGGEVWGVNLQQDILYVADGPEGLIVYDTNGGLMPIQLGKYKSLGNVWGVAADGNVVYATALQDSLQVFELVGSSLEWRGATFAPDSTRSVTLDDTIAYVACGVAGVAIYDKSFVYAPEHLITVNTPGFASRVYLDGDTAWVTDQVSGVAALDITDPAAATYIQNVATQDDALGLAKSGNLLYVAESNAGMIIYDITNLSSPILMGGIIPADTATARDVALYGQYALVAAFEAGLRIVDIDSPANPVEVAYIDLEGHARSILVDSVFAYVAVHDEGFAVVDLSDPLNPVLNAYTESPGSCIDLTLIGDQVLLADTYCIGLYNFDPYAGVKPLEVDAVPRDYSLLSPFPNPFNATTTLGFNLPKSSSVRLQIYDLGGRLVAELVDGSFPGGAYQVQFESSALGSGIYFARFQAGAYIATQKLVLLK